MSLDLQVFIVIAILPSGLVFLGIAGIFAILYTLDLGLADIVALVLLWFVVTCLDVNSYKCN
jgi:hypothetical protein